MEKKMKKISSLGKAILLIIFTNLLFSNVTATVDKKLFYAGDSVTLQIKATGENIEFPDIKDIAGFPIVGTSTSEQIYVINGKTTRGKMVNYSFVPSNSMEIPSFSIVVNGRKELTPKIAIKKTTPQVSTAKDAVILTLSTLKDKVYVGEAIETAITFKYKVGLNIVDAKLEPFKPKNFWVKELKGDDPKEENGYMVYKTTFLVFPQKSGELKLGNQLISVSIKDFNSYETKELKVFSNDKAITVQPLGGGLSVQGEYKIQASVDKTATTSNNPTNLTLSIEGFGNIDDIEEFKLDLPEQVVYSSKPTITQAYENGRYGGTFIQKISIISDRNFTIPPITFKYFDKKTKKEIDLKTTAFNIKVIGKKKNQVKVLEEGTADVTTTQGNSKGEEKYFYLFGGLILGSFITYFLMRKKYPKAKQKERPFEVNIKKAKTDKELYDLLLPYSQKVELKEIIKQLEENLYFSKINKIDKNAILEVFESEEI